jgi:hypothetical protein
MTLNETHSFPGIDSFLHWEVIVLWFARTWNHFTGELSCGKWGQYPIFEAAIMYVFLDVVNPEPGGASREESLQHRDC